MTADLGDVVRLGLRLVLVLLDELGITDESARARAATQLATELLVRHQLQDVGAAAARVVETIEHPRSVHDIAESQSRATIVMKAQRRGRAPPLP